VRSLQRPAFDSAQYGEQIWRRDLSDRPFSEPRKNIAVQAADDFLGVIFCPVGHEFRQPFAGNSFECFGLGRFGRFLLCARMMP
jgi:hypothetical protein